MDVCVLGLGNMGSAIAERLVDAGHAVRVWNRTAGRADALVARGATEVAAPTDAWNEADVCITVLSDSDALTQMCLDPVGGLARDERASGKLLIDMSTVSTDASAEVARAAAATGVGYVRAPVSGNPGVVRAGNLTILASGAEADLIAAEQLLTDIGPHVYRAGDGESSRVIKLALNVVIAGTAELLAECIALAEAHGVDRESLLEIVSASAVGSPFVKYKTGPLLAEDYTATFTTRMMRKDLDLALAAGDDGRVPLPVTAVVRQLLDRTIDHGFGDLDFMSLLPSLQRDAESLTR